MTSAANDETKTDTQKSDLSEQEDGEDNAPTTTTTATATSTGVDAESPDSENNDLVMRDGFPALLIPGTKRPLVDGEEPIPRHSFWSQQSAIDFAPQSLEQLRHDCEVVFTAREKDDGQAYSTGQTFFLPAKMKPRCALEGLVLSIFEKHVENVDKSMYNLEQSGAEWWTLVLDGDSDGVEAQSEDDGDENEEDEVGLHFDADYELEDQATNLLLHPRLATVTYLSDYGAPTLILDQKSPPMQDIKKTKLEEGISRAWLSHPSVGKHTAFDGRLLHGAPAFFFPSHQKNKFSKSITNNNHMTSDEGNEPHSKRQKILPQKRITLLVNIWLNHWVLDAAILDDEVVAKLTTPWQEPDANGKSNLKKGDDDDDDDDDSYKLPYSWNQKVDLAQATSTEKVKLNLSSVDPAGEEEIALCNHTVTVKYNPTMDECHKAAAAGPSVELGLSKNALSLHVGDELPSDDEEDGEDEEDKLGKNNEK